MYELNIDKFKITYKALTSYYTLALTRIDCNIAHKVLLPKVEQ